MSIDSVFAQKDADWSLGGALACYIGSFEEWFLQLRLSDAVSLLQRSILNALQAATDLSLQRIGVSVVKFPQGVLVEIAEKRCYLGIQV